MTARIDLLIEDGYFIVKFADLPTPYQMAIVWRTVMECDGWEDVSVPEWKTEDEAKVGISQLLAKYVEVYGEVLFGTAALKADSLKSSVMQDEDIAASYAGWDDYHADYTRGQTPTHPDTDRWPVILSCDDYETLSDGWHRFHNYIRDGAVDIPAVFYPMDHHLLACGFTTTSSPQLSMR